MSQIDVSVVVPTLNSGATLEKCLESIRGNTSRYRYEIIVVDGGSTDDTVEIAGRIADVVLASDTHYAGANRNKGFRAAQGNIVCFTDSDCVVPQDWIDGLADGLLKLNQEDSSIVGVGGGNVPLLENPTLMELAVSRAIRSPLVAFGARNVTVYDGPRQVSHNPPMNSAYFKEILEAVDGFGEECAYGGEDLELDARITEKGHKLYYLPDGVVLHKHRSKYSRFTRQMYLFGRARIRVGRKFRRYLPLHHYGPALLCLMTFSPLTFIPLGMALANGAWVSVSQRDLRLFPPLALLTVSFYVCYGAGEIVQLVKGE